MSFRLNFLSEGIVRLAVQKDLITRRQADIWTNMNIAYYSRQLWAPSVVKTAARFAGYGSQAVPLSPASARSLAQLRAAHPGTLGISAPRGSIIVRGLGRALGWASVVWTFATLEQPGTTSTGSFRD